MIKKCIKDVGKDVKEILSSESKPTFERKNREFVKGKFSYIKK